MNLGESKSLKVFQGEKVWKNLIKISIPIMILALANASYTFFDAILISILVDSDLLGGNSASAVIAIALPIIMLFFTLIVIWIVGISILIPRQLGQKKFHDANQTILQGFILVFLFSLIIFLGLILVADAWMGELGSSLTIEAKDAGAQYIRVSGISIFLIGFRDTMLRTLRGEGKIVVSSIIPIFGLLFNIFFDWVFMGVLGLSIVGAAYATIIGSFVGLFLVIIYVIYLNYKRETIINFRFQDLSFEKNNIKEMVQFGLPTFLTRFFRVSFFIVFTICVTSLIGENWNEFTTALVRTMIFGSVISVSVAQSASVYLSYTIGQDEKEKSKEILKWGLTYIFLFECLAVLLIIILRIPILEIFKVFDGIPESNYKIYEQALILICLGLPIIVLQLIPMIFYQNIKKVKLAVFHSFLASIVFGIGFLLIFYFGFYELSGNNSNIFFLAIPIIGIVQLITEYLIFIKIKKDYFNKKD